MLFTLKFACSGNFCQSEREVTQIKTYNFKIKLEMYKRSIDSLLLIISKYSKTFTLFIMSGADMEMLISHIQC